MGRMVKPLSDAQIKSAKAKEKAYSLFDGGGLYLQVTEKGYKWWRLRYNFRKKTHLVSLGVYPYISLKDARERRDEYKKLIAKNIDPKNKGISSGGKTVEKVTNEWYNQNKDRFSSNYRKSILVFTNNRIIPTIGQMQIANVTVADIIALGKTIELEGHTETLSKTLTLLGQIFRYAVSLGYIEHNIISDIDKKSAFKRHQTVNYPVIIDDKGLGELLRLIDDYHGNVITKYALKLAPHVFLRPYNIRFAEWSEFDFEKNIWRIPSEKIKMEAPHITPLSTQVVKILDELKMITGNGKYLFPSPVTTLKPISDGTLVKALRRLDYTRDELVAHSFRGIASTILHENMSIHGVFNEAIELQLTHSKRNKVEAAYNHAKYMNERTRLMQWWSDYLDRIKTKSL